MKFASSLTVALMVLGLPTVASAQGLFDGYSFLGNAGLSFPDGVVADPPGGGDFFYVSTYGGLSGVGSLAGVGGSGSATNGSLLTTDIFTAAAGNRLVFSFNYVTSDGAGYADYAWSSLINVNDPGNTRTLYTARTTPGGDTVPGFSMPALNANLSQSTTDIRSGAPTWSQLGGSSGTCFSLGCGHTGWVRADFEIEQDGEYRLQFGVTNWNDTAYDSGMAIKNLTPNFETFQAPKRFETGVYKSVATFGDYKNFDQGKPTVIITHGWQDGIDFTGDFGNVEFLKKANEAIANRTGSPSEDYNVIFVSWEDAFTDYFGLIQASQFLKGKAETAGYKLADKLFDKFTSAYKEPIHFIGHSLGTVVNAKAVQKLTDAYGLIVDHVTILDAPLQGTQVSKSDFKALVQNERVTYVDNYFGNKLDAVGAKIKGTALDGGFEKDQGHTGVWEDYLKTVLGSPFVEGGFIYSAALKENGGWANRPGKDSNVVGDAVETAQMTGLLTENAQFSDILNRGGVWEGSDGFLVLGMEIPLFASTMSFDFDLIDPGDGDWFEFFVNDVFQTSLLGTAFGQRKETLYFDLEEFSGKFNTFSIFLNSKGHVNAFAEVSNFRYISEQQLSAVPLPASSFLLALGFGILGFLKSRAKRGGVGVEKHYSALHRPIRVGKLQSLGH